VLQEGFQPYYDFSMASSTTGIASGADFDSHPTRRRNVPSASPGGGPVNRVEIDEKKTQGNQVSCNGIATYC
jgi:hypothetical protein